MQSKRIMIIYPFVPLLVGTTVETADIANNVINQQSEPPLIGDFGAQSSKPPRKKGRVTLINDRSYIFLYIHIGFYRIKCHQLQQLTQAFNVGFCLPQALYFLYSQLSPIAEDVSALLHVQRTSTDFGGSFLTKASCASSL